MKVSILAIILITVFAVTAQAQQEYDIKFDREGRIITVPKQKMFDINIPKYTYKIKSTENVQSLSFSDMSDVQSIKASLPTNITVLSSAYRPMFDPFTPMIMKSSPHALDFREASLLPINEKLALLTTGGRTTWPLLGSQIDLTSLIVWQHERLTISGGGFIGRYSTPQTLSMGFESGIYTDLRLQLHEKISLRSWGKYTYYDKDKTNPYLINNPVYNYTGFGSAVEYMFNENFGVAGGIEYQFNYQKGKLEPRPVVYPIFKGGKISIGR